VTARATSVPNKGPKAALALRPAEMDGLPMPERYLVRANRRAVLAGAVALLLTGVDLPAFAAPDVAVVIANHFSAIKSMQGEFVQFGPKGEQTGGKFFIQRPGKVRFNYEAPSAYRVVSDGKSVVVSNTKLKTADLYPLSKTPLKLLLGERIDLSGDKVKTVKVDNDLVTVKLQDKSVFGSSTISMMFDSKSYDLRQWTITDAQGKDTTVMIFNVQSGMAFDPGIFKIDYSKVQEANRFQPNR
jgi:outer membrane lipoprotein-sorting protein